MGRETRDLGFVSGWTGWLSTMDHQCVSRVEWLWLGQSKWLRVEESEEVQRVNTLIPCLLYVRHYPSTSHALFLLICYYFHCAKRYFSLREVKLLILRFEPKQLLLAYWRATSFFPFPALSSSLSSPPSPPVLSLCPSFPSLHPSILSSFPSFPLSSCSLPSSLSLSPFPFPSLCLPSLIPPLFHSFPLPFPLQ